eukprot:g5003.t1
MGCSSSKDRGSRKVGPDKGKENADMKRGSASNFRQNLVRIHSKDAIAQKYNLPDLHDDRNVLGSGATSTVRIISSKTTGSKYALKAIKFNRMSKKAQAQLLQEVKIMQQLDHPNVIKIVEVFRDAYQLYIIMELCTGGELFDKLYDQPGTRFAEDDARKLLRKMLQAVAYIHQAGICHRDIKLENFIFTNKGPDAEIKMIDFGYSKAYLAGSHMRAIVGTSYYIAPEVLRQDYTEESDIWSLGVVAFMMLSGRCPFGGNTDEEIQENVLRGVVRFRTKLWGSVSEEAKAFVSHMLRIDPTDRPSAARALQHPWLTGVGNCDDFEPLRKDTLGEDHIDEPFISHLMEFKRYSRLKKAALMAVAFSLDDDHIKSVKKAFEEIDTENTGTITFKEFQGVMQKHGVTEARDLRELFDSMDQDHSGMIKWTEFIASCVQERTYLQEDRVVDAFNRLDVDNSGVITKQNLIDMLGDDLDEDAINRIMNEADFLKDGVIHLSEFKRMMAGEVA